MDDNFNRLQALTRDNPRMMISFKEFIFKQIGYKPHFGQRPIHFDDWTYFVCVWGRRAGKTHGVASEAIAELAIPDHRTWVVAPNYSLCEKVFREVWQAVVMDGALGDPAKILKSKRMDGQGHMKIETNWGSWIEGKSADSPNSLVGEGLDLLIIDEAAKINALIWEKYLEPTLIDRKGRALMISTPEGHNWFWHLWRRGAEEETMAKGWRSSQIRSNENPYLDKEWIASKKADVTPEVFRQEYEASFEHHTGLVWKEYIDLPMPRGHLFRDSDFVMNNQMSHYRCIDPGLDNPTFCLWAAVDENDNVYIYEDYEVRDVLVDVHAANIKVKTRFPIEQTFIGHDAARTSPTDGKRPIDIYRDQGIYCQTAPRDVWAGIQIVARYFRETLKDKPTKPRLYIHENCGALRASLVQYVMDEHRNLSDKNAPDQPKKRGDHGADSLRMLLATEPVHQAMFREQEVNVVPRRPIRPGRASTGM